MNEKYTYRHMRQSNQWFEFWKLLGWERIDFEPNISARVSKSLIQTSIIIEKPTKINKKTLEKIEKYARDIKAGAIKITPGLTQDTSVLDEASYAFTKSAADITKTGIIDLSNTKKLSYRVRHLIKKAGKMTTVTITDTYTTEEIDEFYEVYRKNGRNKGFYTYSRKEFHHFMHAFKNNAYLCAVHDQNGKYLGGCVFACEGKTAWLMFSAVNKKGRDLAVGYNMLWEGINFLKEREFQYLDLEGLRDERYEKTNSSQGGYSEFKEHFHPNIVYYPMVRVKYFSRLAKLIDTL